MVKLMLLEEWKKEVKLSVPAEEIKAFCAYENEVMKGYCAFRLKRPEIELIRLFTDPSDPSLADALAGAAAGHAEKAGMKFIRVAGEEAELIDYTDRLGIFKSGAAGIEEFFACRGCGAGEQTKT